MNTPPLEALVQKASREALTEEEREHMRMRLADYATFRPIGRAQAARIAWWLPQRAMAFATAFLVLMVGAGGSAYAAEGALPGDILYPIKVHVTEPAVTALTPSGRAQVTWQITIAKRRLKEAATLSGEGRLATSTEATLTAQAADATLRGAADASMLATVDATAAASTTEVLGTASQLIEEGRARLKNHDEKGASRAFRASIRAAAQLQALTNMASTTFSNDPFENTDVIVPDEQDAEGGATQDNQGAAVIQGVLPVEILGGENEAWKNE